MAALGMLLAAGGIGCARYTPPPVNPDARVEHSVSKYEAFVFDEEPVPIRVCLSLRSVEDNGFAQAYEHALKMHLEAHKATIVADERDADIAIDIYTSIKEITPVPMCRVKQQTKLTFKDSKGNPLMNPWTHESAMPKGVKDADEARRMVREESIRALSEWFSINYQIMTVKEKSLASSVFRIKAERGLVSFNTRGEKVATGMLYDIKAIPGVIDVRLVEKDFKAMAFSYRVFYNRKQLEKPMKETMWSICRKYK